jgi:hypothetical protein
VDCGLWLVHFPLPDRTAVVLDFSIEKSWFVCGFLGMVVWCWCGGSVPSFVRAVLHKGNRRGLRGGRSGL